MIHKLVVCLLAMMAQIQASAVLLPLYVYPGSSAWNTYISTIKSSPSVTFRVVININSGPGFTQYPDSNWQAGIQVLKKFPNVMLLGYVHTSQATRLIVSVASDIQQYNNWSSLSSANISMDGIFFDEAPSKWTPLTSTYMRTAVNTADTAWSSRTNTTVAPYIVFNPGVAVDDRFFGMADNIIVWENSYQAFGSNVISAIPTQYASQSAVLIHTFTGSLNDQAQIVRTVMSAGISQLFISDQAEYDGVSSIWAQFCAALGG